MNTTTNIRENPNDLFEGKDLTQTNMTTSIMTIKPAETTTNIRQSPNDLFTGIDFSQTNMNLSDYVDTSKKRPAKEELFSNERDIKKQQNRVDFVVPFEQKDRAKSLGAMWDSNNKRWFCLTSSPYIDTMKKEFRIFVSFDKTDTTHITDTTYITDMTDKSQENKSCQILLNVPFSAKENAKALGAKWNKQLKQWYCLSDSPYLDKLLGNFQFINPPSSIPSSSIPPSSIPPSSIPPSSIPSSSMPPSLFIPPSSIPSSSMPPPSSIPSSSMPPPSSIPSSSMPPSLFIPPLSIQPSLFIPPLSIQPHKIYLNVPFIDKEKVKSLECIWDMTNKQWFVWSTSAHKQILLNQYALSGENIHFGDNILSINTTPQVCWFTSFKDCLGVLDFNKLSNHVVSRAGNLCEYCGNNNTQLDIAPLWSYNFQSRNQRLERVVSVCFPCYCVTKITQNSVDSGDSTACTNHLMQIRKFTDQELTTYNQDIKITQEHHDEILWTLDISILTQAGFKVLQKKM